MDPDPASLGFISLSFLSSPGSYVLFFTVLVILLAISAAMSGAEVAFFALTKVEIEDFQDKTGRTERIIQNLLQRPKKLLATILITNNLVNVAIILISTLYVRQIHESLGWDEYLLVFLEVVVITFIILFFGEITPKVFASQKRLMVVKALALPIRSMEWFFTPMSVILINSTSFIDKRINLKKDKASFEDIKNAIDLYSDDESPDEEKEILKGLVKFSSTSVKSIMTARVDVKAIDVTTTFTEVIDFVNGVGHSRLPIYEENLDNIKGILHIKDLLPLLNDQSRQGNWLELIRSPYFVPETKKIDDLLEEIKDNRMHIAIVVDEFGGTSGIVTLEDVIEEIFGEINDEFDEEELISSKLSETEYVFDGKMPLNDLIKQTGLPESIFDEAKGESDSLAGLILEIHGKIPEKGEVFEYEYFQFIIESVAKNRIKRIKFVILEHKRTASAEVD